MITEVLIYRLKYSYEMLLHNSHSGKHRMVVFFYGTVVNHSDKITIQHIWIKYFLKTSITRSGGSDRLKVKPFSYSGRIYKD